MKKIILWLGRVPSSIRANAKKALIASTFVYNLLKSNRAEMVTSLIPGDWDNALRLALIQVLELVNKTLRAAASDEEKKMIAGKIGSMVTQKLDGDKSITTQEYTACFERVFHEEVKERRA